MDFKPLAGIRAVELGHFVAGPNLGSLLTFFGAEVVKVEPPQGDISLRTAPWAYHLFNMGKRDICLDISKVEGQEILKKLVASSDILVENLSPESVEKLGLGYERLSQVNPRLIYCSIKGFSRDSPDWRRPAFDAVAQAEGGLMATTGSEGWFARVNNPSVDMGAAAYGLAAIALALIERNMTGRGRFIEVPLFDLAVYWSGYWIAYYSMTGKEPERLGTGHSAYSPYGVYRTSDGHVFIGVITDEQWIKLCRLLGIPITEELETMRKRIENRSHVNMMVEAATSRYTTESIISLLAREVPVAKVRTIADLAGDYSLVARGLLKEMDIEGMILKLATPPIITDCGRVETPTHPAKTGSDTVEILKRLGYGDGEILDFKRSGVIR
ncbi:Succinyl-CoA--L-malate CoA-transferase beta subunit [archaeon HR01]|nr:Succinyl-CoA--L-malate CoA-transferase beta subunit [archaeon HR01]